MSSISFSGLASGIDWDTLREQLMAVEWNAAAKYTTKQSKIEEQKEAYNDLKTRMSSLLDKIKPLLTRDSTDEVTNVFDTVSATSSNSSVVTATADTDAEIGTYDIRVQQLAQAASVISAKDAAVASFTAKLQGNDLNADIEAGTTLLSSLHRRDTGAAVVGDDLGELVIDDGVTGPVTVDLAAGLTAGSTVQEALDYVNGQLTAAGSGVSVAINADGNGLAFTSTTGAVSIADGGDGKSTATKLGLATAGSVASVDSGDLDPSLQSNTSLSVLNGGAGIADLAGGLVLRNGTSKANIDLSSATTVGSVLNAISGAGLSTNAAISDDGKGITLTSIRANCSLGIEEKSGSTAANLGIFGTDHVFKVKAASDEAYTDVYVNGGYDSDGTTLSAADISGSINAIGSKAFSASVVDGRLTIRAKKVGIANELCFQDDLLDGGMLEQLGILTTDAGDGETISDGYASDSDLGGYLQRAQDAVFSVDGLVVTRSQNLDIDDVVTGLSLNLLSVSDKVSETATTFPRDYKATTLTVDSDDSAITSQVQAFINQYNSVIDFIDDLTYVDTEGDEDGVLSTDSTVKNLSDNLLNVMIGMFGNSAQEYQSIFEMKDDDGNAVFELAKDSGQITFNAEAFAAVLADHREDVEKLFRSDDDADRVYDSGLMVSMKEFVESYTDAFDGILTQQLEDFKSQLDQLDDQIEAFRERMNAKDAALKRQYASAESLLATLNSTSSYISSQLASLSS